MRWARVAMGGRAMHALIEGDTVFPVEGNPFFQWRKTGQQLALDQAQLLVPVIPPTFYACGLNYTDHVHAVAAKTGKTAAIPVRPEMGYRANNALIAHGEAIVIPADAGENVQYEGELVVVIGRQAKHLGKEDAMSCVFGYTIGNDVSERDWQASDRTFWRAKNTDTFKPMGPWIETEADPDTMGTKVRVNGREVSHFPTNAMLFSIAAHLETLTRYVTLYPGDVIWMGTGGDPGNIADGDTVEVEISGIGILSNPVRRAAPPTA